ncbi:MAG: D-mannonate epimerase [Spirochaeta sp. LUC14_002_19_P3]|nr:MAG: D-mannonate epimerase [Spirochaeta sp. LUC14_002_19_P3]
MILYRQGGLDTRIPLENLRKIIHQALKPLGTRRKVLIIPPDITRLHSHAGDITCHIHSFYGTAVGGILPALGTHAPMSENELARMFPGIPQTLFMKHNWRSDLAPLGTVPGSYLSQISDGMLSFDWPARINKNLVHGGFDLILSIGQVLPHEVVGMSNHSKNILIGTGGAEAIHKSHYLGAVYGMERIMGQTDTPVRAVLDYAMREFAHGLPIVYILTVVEQLKTGATALRGLYIGNDRECFEEAAELSRKVNIIQVEKPISKCVVYLNPNHYRTAWLGNKAIYRTRMALAHGAELIILGPGVRGFGEDKEIDRVIRQYGYSGRETVMNAVRNNADLAANLCAAAHLIHGSPEGCFRITWAPGGLSREEIQNAGYEYADINDLLPLYSPLHTSLGWNTVNGENVYFIPNPSLGLWRV